MRTIRMTISGDAAALDSAVAGVQGSGNVDTLDVAFDAGWDGFAKTVTWWDALGQNPVKRTLTTDLLADITADTRRYLVAIPPEPLAAAGRCQMVVDGYLEGKRARSVCVELEVLAAPKSDGAGESLDPTPSQAEQLQGQVESVLADLALVKRSAAHGPYVGENGNWAVWDLETETYRDSGIYAGGSQGEKGEKGDKGDKGDPGDDGVLLNLAAGMFAMALSAEGHLLVAVNEGEEAPPLEIDGDTGHLVYKISTES